MPIYDNIWQYMAIYDNIYENSEDGIDSTMVNGEVDAWYMIHDIDIDISIYIDINRRQPSSWCFFFLQRRGVEGGKWQ